MQTPVSKQKILDAQGVGQLNCPHPEGDQAKRLDASAGQSICVPCNSGAALAGAFPFWWRS